MLFSNDRVADYINNNFEAAWQSVRPVPTVTVDFGNGKTIRRTLRGNIATYVCDSQGRTLDVLPGIYEPKTYLEQLKQLSLLSRWISTRRNTEAIAKNYHQQQHEALTAGKPHKRIIAREVPRFSIVAVEGGVRYTLAAASEKDQLKSRRRGATKRAIPNLDSPEELAEWQPLFDDTQRNESTRRLQIHKHLAEKGFVSPAEMTKWLFREVLDADLDDPYMGLGKLLGTSAKES